MKKRIWSTAFGMLAVAAAVIFVSSGRRSEAKAQSISTMFQASGEGYAERPLEVNMAAMPVVAGRYNGPPRVKNEHYFMSEQELEMAKLRAALPGGPRLPQTMFALPSQPGQQQAGEQTPSAFVNFDGDTEFEAACGGWIPADQALAVGDGANPIIQMVNECFSVWSPAGARLFGPVSLVTFFGQGVSVCDPRAMFDWKNHRFIVMAITCANPPSASDKAVIAVSQTDSATGLWNVYSISSPYSTNALMDYPRMGQDYTATYPGTTFPGAIYVAYNDFNPGFVGEEWHVLPKGLMYNGSPLTYYWLGGPASTSFGTTNSTHPANVFSPYEHPRAEFLITSPNVCSSACNVLTVWAISNPFGFASGGQTPEVSQVTITAANAWTVPPASPQSGGPNNVDSLDNRFTGSVTYAHGLLYAAHSTANGTGGAASLLYQIQPFLNSSNNARCTTNLDLCPQITSALIRNETILNYGTTSSAFMAASQPDLEGNVTTVFNVATTSSFPSMAYVSQRATQTPGTFIDTGVTLVNGLGTYTSGRWGDYMAISPVGIAYQAGSGGPTGNNAMAFSGMYSDTSGTNGWRTRIGANIFNAPNQFGPIRQAPAPALPMVQAPVLLKK